MRNYLDLLQLVLDTGVPRSDLTGTGTRSIFGHQLRFDLKEGFPLLTTKKIHAPSVIHELLWFISGDTNAQQLQEVGVRIWNEWADDDGELGPIYGRQWRAWRCPDGRLIDQLELAIDLICNDPTSRRILVSAWNVADLKEMALMPCHTMFQFYVQDGRLSSQLYQRSGDIFLGVPFNIASYALLTQMMAQICNLEVGEFIHTFGDVHLYENHIEQARLQLVREPRPLPQITLNSEINCIDEFTIDDVVISNYDPHPRIAAPVAI